MTVSIRPFDMSDWPALWPILNATFEKVDTCTFPPGATEDEVLNHVCNC